jgi:DNA-binding response OmpR family regulator
MPLILIVEDDLPMQETLVEFVVGLGYETRVAATAADAVSSVEIDRPDAILLDMMLPDAAGTVTLQRLRAVRPNVPIVMLTANTDEDVARATLKQGAFDYVSKPFERGRIAMVLEAALNARP